VGEWPEPSEAVKVRVTSETVTTFGVDPLEIEAAVPELEGCPSPEMVNVRTEAAGDETLPGTVEVATDWVVTEPEGDPDPPEGV
jgi:hypothetical protein